MEQLGTYYNKKHGVDFRCLRYPGFISPYEYEANGTTDYASQIFFAALKKTEFKHYLSADRRLPMIYLDDGIEGTIKFLLADDKKFTSRVYNLPGLSFTCREISRALKAIIPEFKYKYEPDFRDEIAQSWPEIIESQLAFDDWKWKPECGTTEQLIKQTLKDIKENKEYSHLFSPNLSALVTEDISVKATDNIEKNLRL